LLLAAEGCEIVAVSDSRGGVYNPDGLDAPALIAHKKSTGAVAGFPGSKAISNLELLAVDCDILIPAAMENQITCDTAGSVKARIVAEGANGPTTPDGDAILFKKGVLVVPDILANSGGVTVSYFEWVQNNYGFRWDAETVNKRLEDKIVEAFRLVYLFTHENGTILDMRTGAYMYAVKKLSDAMQIRGWL